MEIAGLAAALSFCSLKETKYDRMEDMFLKDHDELPSNPDGAVSIWRAHSQNNITVCRSKPSGLKLILVLLLI